MPDTAATAGRSSADSFRQLIAARELLWSFVERDLIVRYRTPVLGIGWALAAPLAQMAIFTMVFTRIAPMDVGMPYPLYAYIGLMAWTLTAASLREATNSLAANPVLVTKVRFPREVLPIASVCTALTDFAVAALLAAGMMWFYRVGISWAVLLFPVVLVVHLTLVSGLALGLAVSNLFWRDVRHVFDVVVTVWMFASAVVYPVQRVGGRIGQVLALNPMTHIIEAYRDVLVRGSLQDPLAFTMVAVASLAVLGGAWFIFQRSERRFAELA
jgi:ABC-type polysaccharide/polyol phosphate export permease